MSLSIVKKTYKITGMSCTLCAKLVESSVSKLDGILNQNVNIETEKINIEYDMSKVKFNNIKRVIEEAGYGVLEEN